MTLNASLFVFSLVALAGAAGIAIAVVRRAESRLPELVLASRRRHPSMGRRPTA